MADKTIKTKIYLKQNTYEYWTTGAGKDYVPGYGEVCFCEIKTGETVKQTVPPTVLFKVGNNSNKFSELNWASALAADVFDWAKKSPEEFTAWVAKTPKTVTLAINGENKDYTIEEAIKLVRSEIAAGGTAAALTIADQSAAGKIKYVAQQGGVDIVEAIEINEGTGIDITVDATDNVPVISHQAKPTTGNAVDATTDTETGNTFITEVTIDSLGHVAGVKSKTVSIPDSPSIEIADKEDTDTEDLVYAVTNLEEGGTLNHTITPTYTAVPTKKYVDDAIAEKVAGAVQYLGTVSAAANLGKDSGGNTITVGKGDFYRASAQFTLGSETVHVGDMVIAIVDNPGTTATNWDVGHLEIDANTWTANSATADGYVTKTGGASNAGKVWKVGADGAPAWLDETHHQAKNIVGASATAKANAAVAEATNSIYLNLVENDAVRSAINIVGAGATKVYSDANGKITIKSTNTWNALSATQDGYVSKDWYSDLYNLVNRYTIDEAGRFDFLKVGLESSHPSNWTEIHYNHIRIVNDQIYGGTYYYENYINRTSSVAEGAYNYTYTFPAASGEFVLAEQTDITYILDCN